MSSYRLRIDGSTFRDRQNREVVLHGINVSGDTKLPAHPNTTSHNPTGFFEGDDVSFVDRPFSIDDAHTHFSRLAGWGFNTIRYLFTWEALEHAGPGKYDQAFVEHTIKVLRVAKEYGFYVFMDPHQDVWSRFSGGSGAPMWTIYACGLDPRKFAVTQAAIVQNTWDDPEKFPRMAWATNYQRLATQTIFTLFFAGREFAPKCIIDGRNIQDYLQEHFIGACKYLADAIHKAGDLEGDVVIGYESVNEPNRGFIGHPDLSRYPPDQNLKKFTAPTGFQAMLTGSGQAVEVEIYEFGSFGPYKSGTQLVDPKGQTTWLDPASWDDTKYGWKRDPQWKLGTDIWAQHGVWDTATKELLLPHYFTKDPRNGQVIDPEYYHNTWFLTYYRGYRDAIRATWPEAMMLMQPCPFEIPPRIKGTKDDDSNMIFASHFYDGITLITKKWNKLWNVDVLGILRGRYSSPAFALKIGETAIRNCFKNQLSAIRVEGEDHMGAHPCLFTEIGIPYDMDNMHAYQTGDYSSQIAAIDANMYAVEGSGARGFTWWVYTADNSHRWGDNWNGEDLSVYSNEDKPLPTTLRGNGDLSFDPSNPSYSASRAGSDASVTRGTLQKTLSTPSMSQSSSALDGLGYRAAEAYVRPTPIAVHGRILSHGFDLKNCTFQLGVSAQSATPQDYPTTVFLPEFHFPRGQTQVEVSGGKWTIQTEEVVAGAPQQILRWWHGEAEQKLTVKGVRRKRGTLQVQEEDESIMDAYWQLGRNCAVM